MYSIRISKILFVFAIALFASLVAFGNITDFQTNYRFVQHVFSMDTISADARIHYRMIASPAIHYIGYALIIIAELTTAICCWIGAVKLYKQRRAPKAVFQRAKSYAIIGLTIGFLTWQVAFMSVGGEWFGMWMSSQWNGVPDAFRFFVTILLVLLYLVQQDDSLEA